MFLQIYLLYHPFQSKYWILFSATLSRSRPIILATSCFEVLPHCCTDTPRCCTPAALHLWSSGRAGFFQHPDHHHSKAYVQSGRAGDGEAHPEKTEIVSETQPWHYFSVLWNEWVMFRFSSTELLLFCDYESKCFHTLLCLMYKKRSKSLLWTWKVDTGSGEWTHTLVQWSHFNAILGHSQNHLLISRHKRQFSILL